MVQIVPSLHLIHQLTISRTEFFSLWSETAPSLLNLRHVLRFVEWQYSCVHGECPSILCESMDVENVNVVHAVLHIQEERPLFICITICLCILSIHSISLPLHSVSQVLFELLHCFFFF